MRPTDLQALDAFRVLVGYFVGTKAEAERKSRLIPIKSAPVAYRAILDAEKDGLLTVYRIGKQSFVDCDELDAFIVTHGAPKAQPAAAPVVARDDVSDIIVAMQKRRRTG